MPPIRYLEARRSYRHFVANPFRGLAAAAEERFNRSDKVLEASAGRPQPENGLSVSPLLSCYSGYHPNRELDGLGLSWPDHFGPGLECQPSKGVIHTMLDRVENRTLQWPGRCPSHEIPSA